MNPTIIIEALNLKSNHRRLYLADSLYDPGVVISVDFRCTDGSQTALAVVTGAAEADDPRLAGKMPTHRVRAYYTGPYEIDYSAKIPPVPGLTPVADDEEMDVDLTEWEDEDQENGE